MGRNMLIENLKDHARKFVIKHPKFKSEVADLVQLCEDEIEEGGSVAHEVELAIEAINQLVEDGE